MTWLSRSLPAPRREPCDDFISGGPSWPLSVLRQPDAGARLENPTTERKRRRGATTCSSHGLRSFRDHPALREYEPWSNGCLAILLANAAAQVDDIALEPGNWPDLGDQPSEWFRQQGSRDGTVSDIPGRSSCRPANNEMRLAREEGRRCVPRWRSVGRSAWWRQTQDRGARDCCRQLNEHKRRRSQE